MQRPIGLFTDFGSSGIYLGQVRSVLVGAAPQCPVVDLMSDAPAWNPRAAAYLLAALAPYWPADMVVMAVVDPGVGSKRLPLLAEIDGRWFVGPDNGLFAILARRAATCRTWAITWQPRALSASFHGRDLFAPVAARLAVGEAPESIGAVPAEPQASTPWPDDLAEIIYGDHYGNAMTGLRAATLDGGRQIRVAGRVLPRARTFSDMPQGAAFWYENSIGLVEISINRGNAMAELGMEIGTVVEVGAW